MQSLATVDYYGPIGNDILQESLCDASCGSSLASYHNEVQQACAGDPEPWDGVPAVWVGDIIWSTYNRTCLKDETTGEFCTSKFN